MQQKTAYILTFLCAFIWHFSNAQDIKRRGNLKAKPSKKDTIFPQKKDSLLTKNIDTVFVKENDTIANDSIKKPKEILDHVVTHDAKDYTIQNAKNKTVTLYNEAIVDYGDINLKAGKIILNYKNNTVFATGIIDSTGYTQRPVFKQGAQESEQDSILFNFKSKKALVYGIKTVQGEMITYGNISKRVNDSTVYMKGLRMTTSKKKIPDYYIGVNKAKFVPGKKIIVGGSQLIIADVPTPVYLPFAYFPLTDTRTSGFIIPTWGDDNNRGFNIQNGGYYFAINDYIDLTLLGDIYTNGSWGLTAQSNYNVRYKFNGNFSIRYQNLINSIRGFNDYRKETEYNIQWRHNQDSKSSPNSRLSASVNLGSRRYFQESINQIDQSQRLVNNLSSSINYYKNFVGTPFNINLTASHRQNSNTGIIEMTLPSLTLTMDQIYPFQGKDGIADSPLKKIGVKYSMQGNYSLKTTDEDFFTSKMFRNAQAGVQHRASASTNMKAFKFFSLSPSINYTDTWYFKKIEKRYDETIKNTNGYNGEIVNDTINGFTRFNKMSASLSLSTQIYGTFNFKKGRLKALRHSIQPSVSWSYTPDLGTKHLKQIQQGPGPSRIETYSPFDGGIFGKPNTVLSNAMSISINNTLEAKIAPKDPDSDEEDKKVTILNNLSLNQSYNFAADSLRWSDLNISAGTNLLNNKLSLNFNARFDPYQVTDEGARINKFNAGIYRLENIGATANYRFSNKDFEKKGNNKKTNSPEVFENTPDRRAINQFAVNRNSSNKKNEKKEAKLYRAKIPWDISLGYSFRYNDDGYRDRSVQIHSIDFNGNIELSPKWKVGYRSGYNIKEGAFTYTILNFSRDLDSWRFNFNWIPFGSYTSYNFFIGVKSSILSDLKWEKRKPADRRLF